MPNTEETEGTPLDAEDWEIAFEPYTRHPGFALTLAYHFINLKEYLQSETRDIPEALAAIDGFAPKVLRIVSANSAVSAVSVLNIGDDYG